MPTNPPSQENTPMKILDEATNAAKAYYDGSLVAGEDRGRREYAYAMDWIHGKAAAQVLEGELTYFVGNANGRGLIRIEVAGAGEHIASMPRGKASEARAAQIVSRFNSHSASQRRIKELETELTEALAIVRIFHEECVFPLGSVETGKVTFGRARNFMVRSESLLFQPAPK